MPTLQLGENKENMSANIASNMDSRASRFTDTENTLKVN